MNFAAPISRDPEILSGAAVFTGTRVPAAALFDFLEEGRSLDEFLDDFPTVRREQVQAILELVKHSLLDQPLERLERTETIAAIRVALAEEDRGGAVPARAALEALGRKHGVSG